VQIKIKVILREFNSINSIDLEKLHKKSQLILSILSVHIIDDMTITIGLFKANKNKSTRKEK